MLGGRLVARPGLLAARAPLGRLGEEDAHAADGARDGQVGGQGGRAGPDERAAAAGQGDDPERGRGDQGSDRQEQPDDEERGADGVEQVETADQ